jgi:hypothetical protein
MGPAKATARAILSALQCPLLVDPDMPMRAASVVNDHNGHWQGDFAVPQNSSCTVW